MPTYDYACSACGHRFEEFQSMSSDPLKKCPACKKSKLERLIGTGAGVIFKGSGFYQTDYRSESYTKDKNNDTDASSTASNTASKTPASGCAPACGTSDAPAGCAMPKKPGKKKD
jgi:putative FmdB family regulatory protein